MRENRVGRAWRGAAAAVVATTVAAVSHSLARGPAPWLGIVLALTVAVPVCILLVGRRLSWVRLSLSVAVSQFVFHGLLLIGVGDAAPRGPVLPAASAHLHAGSVPMVMPVAAMPAHHDGIAMWAAHAVAAIITILAFGYGERVLRGLLRLSRRRLAARLRGWSPSAPIARLRPSWPGLRAPHASIALSAVRRRGPPATA